MAIKPEDRFKSSEEKSKTYEAFESDAKASGLYDTFTAEELETAKKDVKYGDTLLGYKKGYAGATNDEDKQFYANLGKEYRSSYKAPSDTRANDVLSIIKQYDDSLPSDKKSTYMTSIDKLLAKIAGDAFSYDAKSDPRYALAEEYAQRAMENQMAESALLTGGYGNSYAAHAGQQIYTDYMNDAVNDMEDRAYSKWAAERENNYSLLGVIQGLEQQEYDRAQTERQWQYQTEQDAKTEARYAEQTEYERRQAEAKETESQANTDYEKLLLKAETLADYGNYDGYRALGYSEEEIASMQKYHDNMTVQNVEYEPPLSYTTAYNQYMNGDRSGAVMETLKYYEFKFEEEEKPVKKLDLNALLAKNTTGPTAEDEKNEKLRLKRYDAAKNKAETLLSTEGIDAAYTYLLGSGLEENDIVEILIALGVTGE